MGCAHSTSTFPAEGRTLIAKDSNVMMEEDICVIMTFRDLRTPNKRSNYLYSVTKGSLAISEQRIVGYVRENRGGRIQRQVNINFQDISAMSGVNVSLNEKGFLCIQSDLSLVHPEGGYSGTMKLVYQTAQANSFFVLLPVHLTR